MSRNSVRVRVMVVDDHPAARAALRNLLGGIDGFALVGEAASGEEALEAAAALSPCLVIMDGRLPGISGVDATRELKARHPEMTVVLVSADVLSPEAVAACGAASFVDKHRLSRQALLAAWRESVT